MSRDFEVQARQFINVALILLVMALTSLFTAAFLTRDQGRSPTPEIRRASIPAYQNENAPSAEDAAARR